MAPPPSALYTTTFFLALLLTLFVGASLRLLAILPHGPFRPTRIRRKPIATRVVIVLGSGGHTHEMFYLLRDLDTRKYTHRTYVVSLGDAFSAGRAREFERELVGTERVRDRERQRERQKVEHGKPVIRVTSAGNGDGGAENGSRTMRRGRRKTRDQNDIPGTTKDEGMGMDMAEDERPPCTGPDHYTITTLPRARSIHQSLLTTPFTCLLTLFASFGPLLSSPSELSTSQPSLTPRSPSKTSTDASTPSTPNPYDLSTRLPPSLILTNGPATSVLLIFASLILKFFNIRECASQGKCKTIYVESFARVKTLSLSGRILVWCVDRFLVQWEELEGMGPGGRTEFWGVLV
jgi:beta-1,4-N-acetylglucosaminyltransferase